MRRSLSLFVLMVITMLTTTIVRADYLKDPVRDTYAPRFGYPAIDLEKRLTFRSVNAVAGKRTATSYVLRLKLLDGRRLTIRDGQPVEVRSVVPSEEVMYLYPIQDASSESLLWVPGTSHSEENVVEYWRKAEAYWKKKFADPRSEYNVHGSEEALMALAAALRKLEIVEHLDIIAVQDPTPDSAPVEGSTASDGSKRLQTLADPVDWRTTMKITEVLTDRGIVGYGAKLIQGSTAVPIPGDGVWPPMGQIGAFGDFRPNDSDNAKYAMSFLAVPKATLACVRVNKVDNPGVGDFAGGLQELVGEPGPWVYATGYTIVFTYPPDHPDEEFSGLSVPMEWDTRAFQKIQLHTGNGNTVIQNIGASHINLCDTSKYPVPMQDDDPTTPIVRPFIDDSGSIMVTSPTGNTNYGPCLSRGFAGPEGAASPAHAIGIAATLVQSAVSVAGKSVPGGPHVSLPVPLRALSLTDVSAAIKQVLAGDPQYQPRPIPAALPDPTLRVQENAPGHELIVQGATVKLDDTPMPRGRIHLYRVYNDGVQPLTVVPTVRTTSSSSNFDPNACKFLTIGSASIQSGKGSDLVLTVEPKKSAHYTCRVTLEVNDPRIVPNQEGKRLFAFDVKFFAPAVAGAHMSVSDWTLNPVENGSRLEFGRLARVEYAAQVPPKDYQWETKIFYIHNAAWAQSPLIVTLPAFDKPRYFMETPWTTPFVSPLPAGPSRTHSIAPGETKTMFLRLVRNMWAPNTPEEETFRQDFVITTNDRNNQRFILKPEATLVKRTTDFAQIKDANGKLTNWDSHYMTLDLGGVHVDEWPRWVAKSWAQLTSFRDRLSTNFKTYTGPLDATGELFNGEDWKKLANVVPLDTIVDASKTVDLVLNLTIQPPGTGRHFTAAEVKVTEPGKPAQFKVLYFVGLFWGGTPPGLNVMGDGGVLPLRGAPGLESSAIVETTAETEIPAGGTYSFPRIQKHAAITRTLTLRNSNNNALTIRGVYVSGPFSVEMQDATIPPGGSLPMAVGFHGGATGAASGELSFYVDGTGSNNNFYLMKLAGDVCDTDNCGATAPAIDVFKATPWAVAAGQPTTLSWTAANATSVTITPNVGTVANSGTKVVNPTATTEYTLTATKGSERIISKTTVLVVGNGPPGSPTISSFTATPAALQPGQSSTLAWNVSNDNANPTVLRLVPGDAVTGNSTSVTPAETTTYVLYARNAIGESSRVVTVNVASQAANPIPKVVDDKGRPAHDWATTPTAYTVNVKPNKSVDITFSVRNSAVASASSNLRLKPTITTSGVKLSKGYHAGPLTSGDVLTVVGGPNDEARFRIQISGRPAGTSSGTVKLQMWGGSRTTPPYDWEKTYEIRLTIISKKSAANVRQGTTELEHEGGFDADAPAQFSVENTTAGPLSLANLTIPPHYAVATPLPLSLAAGQTGNFALSKLGPPSTAGPHNVSFEVSDPEDPNFSVRENHKPIAVADAVVVAPGSNIALDVTENDSDPDGDSVSLAAVPVVVQGTKGTVTQLDDQLVYTPNADVTGGNDEFTYEVIDGAGGWARAKVTVSIGVPNQKPVANADEATTPPGAAVTIDVVANDTDPDGDQVVLIDDPVVIDPTFGTAVSVGDRRNIRYTPNAGFTGDDSFTYEIGDGHGRRARGVVTIHVENSKPTAVPDAVTIRQGQTIVINVTQNDYDADGGVVMLIHEAIAIQATNGTATRVNDSSVQYTPNPDFRGIDVFTYEIGDGEGRRARATVTVTVVNEKPVANPDAATTRPSREVVINVTANDSDPDGDTVVLISDPIVIGAVNGTAMRFDNNKVWYKPNGGFTGTDTFTYEIGDGHGRRARAEVTVTVSNTKPVANADSATTNRNEPVTVNVTANDNDPDGDTVVLISDPIVVAPAHGTAVRVDANHIRYTPNQSYSGPDTLTYEIGDGFGMRARAVLSINVTSSGPPAARNDHAITKRDTPVTINVLANDTDVDGQPIVFSGTPIKTNPRHGTAAVASSTTIKYTPEAGWSGNDVFEYEIADAAGNRDRAWVAVHVGRTRSLPVASDDNAATIVSTSVTINVLANDYSPDGDPVMLTAAPVIARPLHGRVTRVSDHALGYTPDANWTGTDTFAYEITDSEGGTAAAFVSVLVTAVNRPPVAANDSASIGAGVPVTIDVTANDSDPDGDPLVLISAPIVVPPQHGFATRVSASSVAYTPTAGYVGADSFQYEISDGQGRTARGTVNVTINDTNHPPEAADDEALTPINTAVTIEVTANDSDVDGHNVVLISNPIVTGPTQGTAVKVNGSSITYTPANGYSGTDRFQYEVGDQHGARARAWVDITIGTGVPNRNPVAVDDEATTRPATAKDIVVTANDSDPDGDPVVLITSPITVAPAHGTAAKVNGTTIRYTPNPGFVGVDPFQYEIGDGRGKRARAWVRITVTDVNTPPVAVADEASTAAGHAVTVVVTANDYDADGDTVVLVPAAPIAVTPLHGTLNVIDQNSIRYTPQAGFTGTDRYQYEIGDGHGGRRRAWVNITVFGANTALRLQSMATSAIGPVAGNDLAEGLMDIGVPVVVLANDVSVNGRPVVLSANPVVTQPLFGTVQRTSNTILTYIPSAAFRGNDRFEYEVVDGDGVATRAWVTVQIPGDNKPPVAVNDVATVARGGVVNITPLTNDTDPDGDTLQLTLRAITTQPVHGVIRRENGTQLTYTPEPTYTGTDTLIYEVTDGRGGVSEATVNLQVIGSALPPVATNDSANVETGRAVTINVLANDRDPDGSVVSVVAFDPPQNGTLVWSDGVATYQSNGGYLGTDTFHYTIADADGLRAQGTVTLTVVAINNLPVAANDTAQTRTRTAVLIGVLANDYDRDYQQRLTVASVTQPARGSVVVSGNRLSVTYTPNNDFAGTDSFTYNVTDGIATVTASVTVTVPNQAPTPRSEILSGLEDTAIPYTSFNLIGNDTDPDGDTLRILSIEQPGNGTFQISPDNTQFTYRPKANWFGVDTFHYTVADPFGAQVRVMSQISVSSVNDAPVANNDTFSVYKNQLLTIRQAQVVVNDTDVENHSIYVHSVGAAANGTTTKLADSQGDAIIEYRPYGEFVGTDSFEYTVADSGGNAYGTARITVNVLQDTKPVPNFTVTCNGLACSFDAGSSTDDRGIVSYQWNLGNSQAAAGKTFTYTYGAAGVYNVRLTVEDTLGQTALLQKTVVVCQTLAIPGQPQSQTINQFFTATFTVTASGTGPLSYQWYEGTTGTTTTPVGTNSNTFTTPQLTATKSYWVKVTSTCSGTVSVNSNTATANVCVAPGVATHPAAKTINYNTATTLTVTPSGSGPFAYQWYEGDTGVTTKPVGTNSSSFTTPALKANTSYWVRVTSTCNGSRFANSNAAAITVTGALARRQKAATAADSRTSITTNWTQPTKAGTLLVAVISAQNGGGYPIADFTAPAGWQLATESEWSNVKVAIYYYPNNPGGRTSETFTTPQFQFRDQILQLAEYEGVAATSALDKVTTSGGEAPYTGGLIYTGSPAVTAQAKEVVVTAVATYTRGEFYDPTDGFSKVHDHNILYDLTAAMHDRFTSAAGSYSHYVRFSGDESAQWVSAVATFRSSDASASAVQKPTEVSASGETGN